MGRGSERPVCTCLFVEVGLGALPTHLFASVNSKVTYTKYVKVRSKHYRALNGNPYINQCKVRSLVRLLTLGIRHRRRTSGLL